MDAKSSIRDAWGESKLDEVKSTVREESKAERKRSEGPSVVETKKEGKPKHWSTTPKGSLVARATTHVYHLITASEGEGGCKEFFEKHCLLFERDDNSADELRLETMDVFKQYENRLETILEDFAASEHCTPTELMARIRDASDEIPQAEKNVQMLLAATEFKKFARLMRMKAKALRKAESAKAIVRQVS